MCDARAQGNAKTVCRFQQNLVWQGFSQKLTGTLRPAQSGLRDTGQARFSRA